MKPNSINRPDLNRDVLARVAKEVDAKAAHRKGREVPTVYRCAMKVEWFRQLTFWERLQILFGCNLVVLIGIATQHSPGKFQPLIMGRVSYAKHATGHMETVVANMLEAQSPKSPIQHEPKGGAQ